MSNSLKTTPKDCYNIKTHNNNSEFLAISSDSIFDRNPNGSKKNIQPIR